MIVFLFVGLCDFAHHISSAENNSKQILLFATFLIKKHGGGTSTHLGSRRHCLAPLLGGAGGGCLKKATVEMCGPVGKKKF